MHLPAAHAPKDFSRSLRRLIRTVSPMLSSDVVLLTVWVRFTLLGLEAEAEGTIVAFRSQISLSGGARPLE